MHFLQNPFFTIGPLMVSICLFSNCGYNRRAFALSLSYSSNALAINWKELTQPSILLGFCESKWRPLSLLQMCRNSPSWSVTSPACWAGRPCSLASSRVWPASRSVLSKPKMTPSFSFIGHIPLNYLWIELKDHLDWLARKFI